MSGKIKPCADPATWSHRVACDADPAASSYQIACDGRSIRFSPCGVASWHPKDVEHRFCVLCGRAIHTPTPGIRP